MSSQQKVAAGMPLLQLDERPTELILLHEGEAALYSRWDRSQRRRLYTIGASSFPGFATLLRGENYPAICLTTKESIISRYPTDGSYKSLILQQQQVGSLAIRSLLREAAGSYQVVRNLASLLALTQKLSDNCAIAYWRCNPEAFELKRASRGASLDPTLSAARVTLNEYEQNGGWLPSPVNAAWLQGDYSSILRREYTFKSDFDLNDFHLVRNILLLPANTQKAIYEANLDILEGMSHKLARMILKNIEELCQLQASLDSALENLVSGDHCYAEKFWQLLKEAGGPQSSGTIELNEIIVFFMKRAKIILKRYEMEQGIPYPDPSPALKKIEQHLLKKGEQSMDKGIGKGIAVGIDSDGITQNLKNAAWQIMNYLKIDRDKAEALMNDLEKLKRSSNLFETYGELAQIRKGIVQSYWDIWSQAYRRYRAEQEKVPVVIKMLLLYGFFDESLLSKEHLNYLYGTSYGSGDRASHISGSSYPIYNIIEWLSIIESKEELPSINELGLSYLAKLRKENPGANWKKEADIPEDIDSADKRVDHEIQNFLRTTCKLTSGSPISSLPILNHHQITVPLDRCFVGKAELSRKIDHLLKVDFSAFHREVLFNDEAQGILKEFIQLQVAPNFIIVPSIGTKTAMWQELSDHSKSSRGRIALPAFATADLYTLLLEAVAAFRWELTRTVMGADWNDLSQSSITSDYTDYVQFYKKNRDLSTKVKEKLSNDFRRLRSDRDRFAHDYANWIKYESVGMPRLNRVARDIFFRHVPYEKSIREKLRDHPGFADLYHRFKNIRTRKLKELEIRYRKYGEDWPIELKNNYKFYSM